MHPPAPTPPHDTPLHTLERHQRRREQGQPVLAGPPGSALALWRRWLDARQRPLCMTLAEGEAEVARSWMEALARARPLEADATDFLCRRLRVALEVDGYYHFQSARAYRRDRRKDVALQCHGYLVLRFLADDVVERVQETRDTLLEVLSQRRDAPGRLSLHREEAHGGD